MFLLPTVVGLLYELFFAVPILSDIVTWSSGFSTIGIAFVIHCIILACRIATKDSKIVPIIAIVATIFTIIPILNWFIHGFIAILYFVDVFIGRRNR